MECIKVTYKSSVSAIPDLAHSVACLTMNHKDVCPNPTVGKNVFILYFYASLAFYATRLSPYK